MKAYVAGPMTGIPQYNFPAFDRAAEALRVMGYEVVSPAELDDPEDRAKALASDDGAPQTAHHFGKSWADFLARDVKLIADGEFAVIVVLPGWEKSRGARLETFVANALHDIPVVRYDPLSPTGLTEVPELELFRAWTGDRTLRIRQAAYA